MRRVSAIQSVVNNLPNLDDAGELSELCKYLGTYVSTHKPTTCEACFTAVPAEQSLRPEKSSSAATRPYPSQHAHILSNRAAVAARALSGGGGFVTIPGNFLFLVCVPPRDEIRELLY